MNWRVERYEELPSTNDEMLRRIHEGEARAGDVVVAATQSAGRGRQGRVWVSERGGLWLTAALPMGGGPAGQMALVAAVAVCEAARRWAPATGVKWPNDLLLNGGKLCGILVEWPAGAECAAVGIGINVGNRVKGVGCRVGQGIDPSDYTLHPVPYTLAAALCEGGDSSVTPEQVLPAVLDALGERWEEWRSGGWGRLRDTWDTFDLCRRRRVRVHPGAIEGTADGITDEGALRIRCDDGAVLVATAGEVEFV